MVVVHGGINRLGHRLRLLNRRDEADEVAVRYGDQPTVFENGLSQVGKSRLGEADFVCPSEAAGSGVSPAAHPTGARLVWVAIGRNAPGRLGPRKAGFP
jgi:hypothetical protein